MKQRLLNYVGYAMGLFMLARGSRQRDSAAEHRARTTLPHTGTATGPGQTSPDQDGERRKASTWAVLKRSANGFIEDDCTTLGASIAYFSVFSLAPLLLTVVSIAGLVFGRQAVQNQIQGQVQGLVGSEAAQQIQSMLAKQADNQSGGILGVTIGLVVLFIGATGAFAALQDALNKTWHVKPDPAIAGWKAFMSKRVLSFGMILGIVFLLMASLAVSAALSAAGSWMGSYLPAGLSEGAAHAISFAISLAVITALFALILKVLPDGHIAWRDAWVGGVVTAVLFTIGKTLIGLYLGKAAPASAYGAAGSLVVIIMWLYYASLIVLAGAEFTKVWAAARGRQIQPEKGAVMVVTEERHARSGDQRLQPAR